MFSSIQFLFLVSLGVFTWAILCYVKQIEEYLMCPSNRSDGTSAPPQYMAGEAADQGLPKAPCRNSSDFYVNFFCILACIYALAKVMHMAEHYLARMMYGKLHRPPLMKAFRYSILDGQSEQSSPNAHDTLRWQVDRLEEQNLELKLKLREATSPPILNEASTIWMESQPGDENKHHIYVTNRHYSVNHNLFLERDGPNMMFQNMAEEANAKSNVWNKYLEMQKLTHKRPDSLWTRAQQETHRPVVLSVEELQNM